MTVYEFPGSQVTIVRRFHLGSDGGSAPLMIIDLGTTVAANDPITISGNIISLSGSYTIASRQDPSASFSVSADGSFNQTIYPGSATNEIQITGPTGTTGGFTSLTIDA